MISLLLLIFYHGYALCLSNDADELTIHVSSTLQFASKIVSKLLSLCQTSPILS